MTGSAGTYRIEQHTSTRVEAGTLWATQQALLSPRAMHLTVHIAASLRPHSMYMCNYCTIFNAHFVYLAPAHQRAAEEIAAARQRDRTAY
jgi:hypothetical protein